MDSLTSFLQWGVPLWAVMGLCVAPALVLWRVLRHTPKAKAAQSADAASSEIFELVKAGEWQVDFAVDQDCTLLSVGAAKIYGWPSQQLRFPFSRWRAHVVADANGRGNPAELFQQALNDSGVVYDCTYAFRRPADGEQVWLHDRGIVQRDDQGLALRMTGMVMDVTDRIQSERQITQTNRVLEQALELAKAATWSWDYAREPDTILFTPRALKLMGFVDRANGRIKREEMAQRAQAAMGAQASAELNRYIDEQLASGQTRLELKYMHLREADDIEVWIHDISSIERDANGMPIKISGVMRDITLERHAEQAILAAMQEAEASSRAKGDFLANMSHEIRTPMNAIIGLSGLALKNEMPPRIKDYLSKIKQSGEHLLGILNDILDFSKIESGKMEIESVAFELDSVISHVVNLSSEKAASKGLELLCHVHSEVPRTLIGDPLRIGQILINMTNNAVKFTQRGEVRIDISVQKGGDTQVVVLFKVQDTGIGLTLEQTGNLFQSFAQADTSITRKYGGTGLGLAISKNLAQAMGGDIGVDSVYGEGSTFWFCVPLGVRALAQPLRSSSSSSTLEDQLAHLGGARILLVEDNEINQLVASELLQHAGFLVDVAENGQIAVHRVQARDSAQLPYDIVLMDMQMPVMDGVSAARLIRQTHSAAQLPIVAMTANAMKADRDRCMQVGMNGVVTKPINPEELWKALLTWVKVRDGMGAIAPATPKTQATESDVQGVVQALRAIPGLDVPLGLLRTNDNPTFYVSLLRKFVVAQEGVATQIRHLWDSADHPTAERMAHTLKGVAGNLGATAVQARAEFLESALRRGDSAVEVDSALVQVANAVDALFDALKATDGFTRTEAALPAQSLTPEDRKAALHITQQIKLLLANDDPQAQELWETHAALLQAVCAHASAVQAAINAFAFDEALQLLNAPNGPEGA